MHNNCRVNFSSLLLAEFKKYPQDITFQIEFFPYLAEKEITFPPWSAVKRNTISLCLLSKRKVKI